MKHVWLRVMLFRIMAFSLAWKRWGGLGGDYRKHPAQMADYFRRDAAIGATVQTLSAMGGEWRRTMAAYGTWGKFR